MSRAVSAWTALGVALAAAMILALAVGAVPIAPSRVLGAFGLGEAPAPWEQTVVLAIRLPRVLLAALGGAGLALAGAGMQGLFRNPLADPGILGVSGGATLGAVSALYLGAAGAALFIVPAAAFVGALAAAALVYVLAVRAGRASMSGLLLAGIAIGGVATALTSFALSLSLARWEVAEQMLSWMMGGLEGRSYDHVFALAPPLVAGGLAIAFYARELDALALGEESAAALGVDVPRMRRVVLAAASLVTAATVAVMGAITFIGLMIPHVCRLLVGPRHGRLLVASALGGALFLVLADTLCRVVAEEADLRPGVVSAFFGGPFFLWLLVRHGRRGGIR